MEKGKNLHQLLLRTQKFTPKVRDSRQSQCFTPPFITLSTRIFTPVVKFLHQQRLHRLQLFPSLIVLGFVAKLCRESRYFGVKFYVANHAVLVPHFDPPKKAFVPQNNFFAGLA